MNPTSHFSENFPLIKKDESELQAFVEKYPWCSVAQLSLLTHYQKTNSEKFEQHATKAALFFNNTNWLNWQLHLLVKDDQIENSPEGPHTAVEPVMLQETTEQSINGYAPTDVTREIMPAETETFEEPGIQEEDIEQPVANTFSETNFTGEIMRAEPETFAEPENFEEQEIQEENIDQPVLNTSGETNFTGEILSAGETFEKQEIQGESMEQPVSTTSSETDSTEEIMPAEPETSAPEMQEENIEQPNSNTSPEIIITGEIMPAERETIADPEIQGENMEQPVYNGSPETNITGGLSHEEPLTSAGQELQNDHIEKPILNLSPATIIAHEIISSERESPEAEMQNETEQPFLNISAINSTDTTEDKIVFEPLHTTDYFASQGIRLTDEPVSQDKLGTQVKSFTEWLKSMKKIHKEKLAAGDEQTDKNIQHIAEHSNVDAEVVTEAMADVLIKQNKNEKAIEVYEKLSLINPSKSAYFAAKIESLSTGRQI